MNQEVQQVKSKLAALKLKPYPLGFCDRDALLVVQKLGGKAVSIEGPLYYRQIEGMMYAQRHIVAELPSEVIVALSDPIEQVYKSLAEYIENCIKFTQE